MNSTTSIFDLANRFARSKQLLSWDDDNNIRELNSLDLLNPLTPSYLICLDVVNEARKKERGLTSTAIRWFISFQTTKLIMIHFVISTLINLKQIRSPYESLINSFDIK